MRAQHALARDDGVGVLVGLDAVGGHAVEHGDAARDVVRAHARVEQRVERGFFLFFLCVLVGRVSEWEGERLTQ